MNYHELLDEATVRLGSALLGSKTFFRDSIDSAPITDVATEATADLKTDALDDETLRPVTVQTPNGTYEAGYRVLDWKRPTLPTILFLHGSGEDPFDTGRLTSNSVTRLFPDPEDIPANIVAIRAPFHDGSTSDYARAMGDLADFVGMLAASTALVEALREHLVQDGAPAVIVSGISLGGWVTTLHRATHDTAEMYVPLFAGDRLGEMFASSAYRKMTGTPAKEDPDHLREVLDFPEAYADASAPTRPLLGRYDRIIEFEVQQPAFADQDLTVIDYGHVTGALQASRLREHIVSATVEAPGRA